MKDIDTGRVSNYQCHKKHATSACFLISPAIPAGSFACGGPPAGSYASGATMLMRNQPAHKLYLRVLLYLHLPFTIALLTLAIDPKLRSKDRVIVR